MILKCLKRTWFLHTDGHTHTHTSLFLASVNVNIQLHWSKTWAAISISHTPLPHQIAALSVPLLNFIQVCLFSIHTSCNSGLKLHHLLDKDSSLLSSCPVFCFTALTSHTTPSIILLNPVRSCHHFAPNLIVSHLIQSKNQNTKSNLQGVLTSHHLYFILNHSFASPIPSAQPHSSCWG